MIEIDLSRDRLIDDYAMKTYKERYLVEGETSPQEAYARAAQAFAEDDDHAQRMYDYASQHWLMFATPVLANGGTTRGLPISCYLNFVDDSLTGITEHWTENTFLSSKGGGIGSYWGAIRTEGEKTTKGSASNGMIPFMKVDDTLTLAVQQGKVRRGSSAIYLDISHPEIEEFLEIRKPSGGDFNRKCLNIHNAVNITDDFMRLIEKRLEDKEADTSWDLVDPNSKEVRKTVCAWDLWIKILTLRMETGEPYVHFIDTSNRELPVHQKALGLEINQSNLCSEIILPTSPMRTAVCCLSSVNLEKFDEWKDTQMVEDMVLFLDNVLQYFIENADEGYMDKAIYSAKRERSIGIGSMGFHAYLQKNMIPWNSMDAHLFNVSAFKLIREKAEVATAAIGQIKGSAPDYDDGMALANHGLPPKMARRNSHVMAIAPNASISILCGNTSPSIEPYSSNCIAQKTLSGTNFLMPKYLRILCAERGLNEEEIKSKIASSGGSIQDLDEFTAEEKAVFKTAFEIEQSSIVHHAAVRQQFIDQAQSVNLFYTPGTNKKKFLSDHFTAWQRGLKTLYYCRSQSSRRAENINSKVERIHLTDSSDSSSIESEDCTMCEG